jgi:Flp pilus assembly protein TadG
VSPHGTARRSRRGVSAIEAAIILPVLFVMLFGVFDWSWYLFHWLTVHRASHACVRIAAGVATADDPVGTATKAARDWLDAYVLDGSAAQVDVSLAGEVLSCQVTVPFEPPVGLVPTPKQLSAGAETSWYGHVFDPD